MSRRLVHSGSLLSVAVVALGIVFPIGATAAQYPDKPLVMIVAFSAGGGTDVAARTIAKFAESYLGQSVVVENRTGAGGQIGFTAIAKAKPDGYTIGFINVPAINMLAALRPDVTYKMTDFVPVANIVLDPMVLAVRSQSPIKTLDDFIQQAKASAGKLVVGVDGPQTNNQLQGLVMAQKLGIKLNFVTYAGAAPALTAALGGHVDATIPSAGEAVPYTENGQLRVLAVFWPTRFPALPNVATFEELTKMSIPAVGASSRGIAVPKGVPEDRLQVLRTAFEKAAKDQGFIDKAKQMGMPVYFQNHAQFTETITGADKEIGQFLDLLKQK